MVFSYPWQGRHKSCTASSSQLNISNLACADNHLLVPSPPCSPSSSVPDLSLPAHHSQLLTQALISISLPHVLTPGESSPNTIPRTPGSAALSTALTCCHMWAESWYASPLQNCKSLCQEVVVVLRHQVKSPQLQLFTGIG